MALRILLAILFLTGITFAEELHISNIVGVDDDAEIVNDWASIVKLKTNTLAATADSSIATFRTNALNTLNAKTVFGYCQLQGVKDTISTGIDTCKVYLYTGYRDTTGLKFLIDSALFAAVGRKIFTQTSATDTFIKPFTWFEVQCFDTSNLAADSANEDAEIMYDLKFEIFAK